MKLFASAFLLLLYFVSPASAYKNGYYNNLSAAKTLIGGFDVNGTSLAFVNFLKLGNNQIAGSTFAFPSVLDANGYPNNGTVTTQIDATVPLPVVYGIGNYIFDWQNTGGIALASTAGNISISTNTCSGTTTGNNTPNVVVRGANCAFTYNFTSGTSFSVKVSFPTSTTYTNMSNARMYRTDQAAFINADGTGFNPDFVSLLKALNPKILRPMDWTSVNSNIISQFNYRAPTTAFAYRTTNWTRGGPGGDAWISAGIDNASSANTYVGAAPPNFGGLVEGTTVQAKTIGTNAHTTLSATGAANNGSGLVRLAMADTSSLTTGQKIAWSSSGGVGNNGGVWTITVIDSTHIDLQGSTFSSNATGAISTATLNIGGTGDIIISGSAGAPLGPTANDVSTIVYDSVIGTWKYGALITASNGASTIAGAIPIEMLVSLANALNVNLWINIQFWYTDASVTALANYVKTNLNSNLRAYYEFSNETWNNGFVQFNYGYNRGINLGFPNTNNEPIYGYTGLRFRQIAGLIEAAYGSQANFKKVLAFQAFEGTVNNQAYRLNGTDLVKCTSACTAFQTNYNNFTASTSYNAFPSRPVDHADSLSYATYYAGGVLNNGTWAASGTYSGMTAAADDYASGNPTQMASAIAWVHNDILTGTSTISTSINTLQTLGALSSTASVGKGAIGIYPSWEIVAASYDAQRAGGGLANLTVDVYEGGLEAFGPSTKTGFSGTMCSSAVDTNCNQCLTIGIADKYCSTLFSGGSVSVNGTVQNMLEGYKNDALFFADTQKQYNDFLASAHSRTPAWFALQGTVEPTGKWSMLPGNTYTGPTSLGPLFTGAPYQSWNGTAAFNAN